MSDSIELPDAVPIMPLPGALLFPHALLPLHIFEPRYRAMLEHALTAHRMFCVAAVKPQLAHWQTVDDFAKTTAVGLIRACVARPDGTSNLILQGLRRVRLVAFPQENPFPIARIEPLETIPAVSRASELLQTEVLRFYERFKGKGREFPEKLNHQISHLSDPEMLADLMTATFISDARRRQEILEEVSVDQRLRLVIQYLKDEGGGAVA